MQQNSPLHASSHPYAPPQAKPRPSGDITMSLLLLPSEILIHIISHLDAFTALHILRTVCRRLNTLCNAVHPLMHHLPIPLWLKILKSLPPIDLFSLKQSSLSFANLFAFLISRDRLPNTYFGHHPASANSIRRYRKDYLHLHPFLTQIQYWQTSWQRGGGEESIASAALFESPTPLPYYQCILYIHPYIRFRDTEHNGFENVVLRKRRMSRVITSLDVLVAADKMLLQRQNEVYLRVRRGVLYICRSAEDFEDHEAVYVDDEAEVDFIDDLVSKEGFLRSPDIGAAGTFEAEFHGIDRLAKRKERGGGVWSMIYVKRF
ncbi:hypothetical protein TWF481_010933 [Arthrobotrys musiformis]|uniref:F-box domain-containing protein n=1 Tax=Arthrobotrys musiformis TaxID=47236 RepID=A0AAV9VXX7_9PEZI